MIARWVWVLVLMLGIVGLVAPPPAVVAQAAPPRIVAHWERPGVARIVWEQPAGIAVTCLSRNPTGNATVILIRCWNDLPAEQYIYLLGSEGPLDAAHHPQVDDVYALQQDLIVYWALLRGVVVVPVLRR